MLLFVCDLFNSMIPPMSLCPLSLSLSLAFARCTGWFRGVCRGFKWPCVSSCSAKLYDIQDTFRRRKTRAEKKKKERQVWRKFHDLASHVGSSNFYLVKHLVIPELGYFVWWSLAGKCVDCWPHGKQFAANSGMNHPVHGWFKRENRCLGKRCIHHPDRSATCLSDTE